MSTIIRDFDIVNITINLQHDKAIYCVQRVLDAACHLSTCSSRQRQYPSSLRGLRGKKVSCFQTSRPFFKAFLHVWSTRTDEISSRWRTNTNCNEGPQTVDHVWWGWAKNNPHEALMLVNAGYSDLNHQNVKSW